jgi:hypothetical protein
MPTTVNNGHGICGAFGHCTPQIKGIVRFTLACAGSLFRLEPPLKVAARTSPLPLPGSPT